MKKTEYNITREQALGGAVLIILVAVALLSQLPQAPAAPVAPATPEMANPAAVFCDKNGGTAERTFNDAGEGALCVLANGVKCEQWAYYRGECGPDAMRASLDGYVLVGAFDTSYDSCEDNTPVWDCAQSNATIECRIVGVNAPSPLPDEVNITFT
jgi:putative hemolysin